MLETKGYCGMKKRIAWLTALVMCIPAAGGAQPLDELPLSERFQTEFTEFYDVDRVFTYEQYAKNYNDRPCGSDFLAIPPSDVWCASTAVEQVIDGRPALLFDREQAWMEWRFSVETAGLYSFELDYYMPGDNRNNASRKFLLDGELPFSEAANVAFRRLWQDDDNIRVNSLGNEIRPTCHEVAGWQCAPFVDSQGFYSHPYRVWLEVGEHTVRLEYTSHDVYVGELRVRPAETRPSYADYIARYIPDGVVWDEILEAEKSLVYKNDTTLLLETDGHPSTSPQSIGTDRLNVVGGWRWRTGGQSLTWAFEAPEDGWYKIGLRYLNNTANEIASYRTIEIDGEVPFAEMEAHEFPYDQNWVFRPLADASGEPYRFYLTKGTHTIRMTACIGPLMPVVNALYSDALMISNILMDISRLTGNDPDPNYDYAFFERIPTLKQQLTELADSLRQDYLRLQDLRHTNASAASNLISIEEQLRQMIADPFSIAARISDLTDAQISLGTYYQNLQEVRLQIDYFRISAADTVWSDHTEAGLLDQLGVTFHNFFQSFTKDYDNIGSLLDTDVPIRDTIEVWTSHGAEWAEIIKRMTDENFTPKTGIEVHLNVVPGSQLTTGGINVLMLAIASGEAPDAAIGVAANSPAEYAFRGAVYDLSQFEDYDEVMQRFLPEVSVPFEYDGGVYALAESVNYYVMFYRKDIMNALRLNLPETWEDVYSYTLPTLYQNGYEFYYPIGLFAPFLFQHEGEYYTEDGARSALDTQQAYDAFKEYCELFTLYNVPTSANFLNRFRTGIMPIGVSDHGTYVLLLSSAPELVGMWGIAPLPGRKNDAGEINRGSSGLVATADVILEQSEHKEAAWEFLKWWTDDQTQTDFAREMEAVIGVEAHWNSANLNAFEELPWFPNDLDVIREQWRWVREVPIIPGSYYTARYISNAWNDVVISGQKARDALDVAIESINKELEYKRNDLSGGEK